MSAIEKRQRCPEWPRSFALNSDRNPAIALAACPIDPDRCKPTCDGCGPRLGQGLVVRRRTDRVRMPFHDNGPPARRLGRLLDLLECGDRIGADRRLVEVEQHIAGQADLRRSLDHARSEPLALQRTLHRRDRNYVARQAARRAGRQARDLTRRTGRLRFHAARVRPAAGDRGGSSLACGANDARASGLIDRLGMASDLPHPSASRTTRIGKRAGHAERPDMGRR